MNPRAGILLMALLPCIAVAADKPSHAPRHVADRFTAADKDGDGRLSRGEAARGMKRVATRFDTLDADHDGHVSRAELAAAQRTGRRPARATAGRHNDAEGMAKAFAGADIDGDGGLTPGEARVAMPRLSRKFDRVDADRDGRITLAELQAWVGTRKAAATRGKPGADRN